MLVYYSSNVLNMYGLLDYLIYLFCYQGYWLNQVTNLKDWA